MVDQSVTSGEPKRRPLPHRLRALLLGAGLLITACSGSDAATSGSAPDSVVESDDDGDVFSEGETTTAGTVSSDVSDEGDADESADVDGADADADASVDPDESEPSAADDPSTSEPAATGDTTASDPEDEADPEPDSPAGDDVVVPEPDEFDELDDLITVDPDDIDDVPFCQSYARILEAFLGITFAGVFGGLGSDDPDAQVALAETYEMILYPGLSSDVETLRGEDVDELESVFGPIFERIDAAPGLLRDAGLSDDEIDELTAGVRPADLESIDLDSLDQRVTDAAVALRSEFGSFLDASDVLATPPDDEEAYEERLDALCPLLGESFGAS